jgi:hypothetical protein
MPENTQEEEFIDFFEEIPDGDPEPSDDPDPEPGDDPEPSDDPEPGDEGGDEPEPDEGDDSKPKKDPRNQSVPFSRYQKTLNEKKRLEKELAEARAGKPASDPDPDPDPDDEPGEGDEGDEPKLDDRSQKAVEKFMHENGYVTKAELERERKLTTARAQIEADKTELSAWAEKNGYPTFDVVAVDKWADENLGKGFVQNKATFKSAYLSMHEDAIREQERKAALADAGSPTATGEKPGSGAKAQVAEDQPTGPGALKRMIHQAHREIQEGK